PCQDECLAAFPDREVGSFAGGCREPVEIGLDGGAELSLVEAGGGNLVNAAPHAVALVVRPCAQITKRNERAREVVERACVQIKLAAELRQGNSVAAPRNHLQDHKAAFQ